MRIGIVSGYFNPLHSGHLEYINAAKKDCNFLIAIVNNDIQVNIKKSKKFMTENHRLNIISNIKNVDEAILSIDTADTSIVNTLESLAEKYKLSSNELIFYNSGDRNQKTSNRKEENICKKFNIESKFLPLPKIYSSSLLLEK